ncbi:MAG: FAD-dependent oxidoreductase, partial [Elusimicrobiota bacterium]
MASTDALVLGGGFAGLAAASALAERGARVTLLERRPHLGGRAYSFHDPRLGAVADNGQHLFMGCYRQTR